MTIPRASHEWQKIHVDTSELEPILVGTEYSIIYRMGSAYPILAHFVPAVVTELGELKNWDIVLKLVRAPLADMPRYLSSDKPSSDITSLLSILASIRLTKGV